VKAPLGLSSLGLAVARERHGEDAVPGPSGGLASFLSGSSAGGSSAEMFPRSKPRTF
jgi:hypothetical protein